MGSAKSIFYEKRLDPLIFFVNTRKSSRPFRYDPEHLFYYCEWLLLILPHSFPGTYLSLESILCRMESWNKLTHYILQTLLCFQYIHNLMVASEFAIVDKSNVDYEKIGAR